MALKSISKPIPEIIQIRAFCKENKIPFTILASLSGISKSAIYKYLSGKYYCPPDKIAALQAAVESIKAISAGNRISAKEASNVASVSGDERFQLIERQIDCIKHALVEIRGSIRYSSTKENTNSLVKNLCSSLHDLQTITIPAMKEELICLKNYKSQSASLFAYLEEAVRSKLNIVWVLPILASCVGSVALSLAVYFLSC